MYVCKPETYQWDKNKVVDGVAKQGSLLLVSRVSNATATKIPRKINKVEYRGLTQLRNTHTLYLHRWKNSRRRRNLPIRLQNQKLNLTAREDWVWAKFVKGIDATVCECGESVEGVEGANRTTDKEKNLKAFQQGKEVLKQFSLFGLIEKKNSWKTKEKVGKCWRKRRIKKRLNQLGRQSASTISTSLPLPTKRCLPGERLTVSHNKKRQLRLYKLKNFCLKYFLFWTSWKLQSKFDWVVAWFEFFLKLQVYFQLWDKHFQTRTKVSTGLFGWTQQTTKFGIIRSKCEKIAPTNKQPAENIQRKLMESRCCWIVVAVRAFILIVWMLFKAKRGWVDAIPYKKNEF